MANIRVLTKLDNINTHDLITENLSSNSLLIKNHLLYVDTNHNRIGINTENPEHDLHVNGTFGAKTKAFVIAHPLADQTSYKFLQYGSLESPYHGVRLTGRTIMYNGLCKIILPNYICKLVQHDQATIQITNYKHSCILYVNEINIDENYFIVKTDSVVDSLEFFWSFTAIRQDVDDIIVEF